MKKTKMNKKEMKEFNKDPLKWICLHIGQEIEMPEFKSKGPRYFIVRFDKEPIKWECPDFIEELPKKELECLAVEGGSYVTVKKLVNWINGGKD